MLKPIKLLALAVAAMLGAVPALAADKPQEWELINPTGAVETSSIDPAPRLTTLEGKTVVLRWNGKNNGNVLLDRLAELLAKRFPKTKVVKSYELDPSLNVISANAAESQRISTVLKGMKPDLIIASQAD